MNTERSIFPLTAPFMDISGLSISFPTGRGKLNHVVRDVTFSLEAGEIMAIVGESGSGKTMLAQSILQLLPGGGHISGGKIMFLGEDLTQKPAKALRRIRGAKISMIFQEPMVSLNPTLKIGRQMCEAMKLHTDISHEEIWRRAVDLLTRVRIDNAEACMEKYAHEFSGGMRQRIMIASSLMLKPALIIADELTTALDCLVQKEVLDILVGVAKEEGTAILLITHDLGLVAQYAHKVLVMEKGCVVEKGYVKEVIKHPVHDYTRKLLASIPKPNHTSPDTALAPVIIDVQDLVVEYPIRRKWMFEEQRYKTVLSNISLQIRAGETLAIVGESGSGKTTLGRAILRLVKAKEGKILIEGKNIFSTNAKSVKEMSKDIQLIFQDPFSSLSPREKIGAIIAEPLDHQKDMSARDKQRIVRAMMVEVGLSPAFTDRYPNELSGGQRQRVSIARALIVRPKIVIADEPVSALDITIQAQILDLLERLKRKFNFTCIFISHDLSVVEQIADRVAVLYQGQIVEIGRPEDVFQNPCHDYTQKLLVALPHLHEVSEHSYELIERHVTPFDFPDGYKKTGADGGQHDYYEIKAGHKVACKKCPTST